MVQIDACPRAYVGHDITDAVNMAGMCRNGIMPIPGGLLDQSAWFVDLWQRMDSERAKIDAERIERMKRG